MTRTLGFAAIAAVGVLACGDNQHPPRLLMDVGEAAPAYGRVPFPNDAFFEGPVIGQIAGIELAAKQHGDLLQAHLATLDGFGLRPVIEFFVQGPIDPATVPATTHELTDALFVLDVDPATGESGAPLSFDWRYIPERNEIVGSPSDGVQLREGTRYAAIITTDVKGPDGQSITPSYQLGLVNHDPPSRWLTTGAALDEVNALPGVNDRVAGITVFTTQRASDALVKARNVIANTSVVSLPTLQFDNPAFIFDSQSELAKLLGQPDRFISGPRNGQEHWGTDNDYGIAHDHVAVVATGTINVVMFIQPDTGTDGPEDETFFLARDGVPQVQSEIRIPITVVLPKAATMPAKGFPVIVFGHGLGGSRHDVLNLAEPITSQGYALVAIDMYGHGSRFDPTDTGNNLGGKSKFTGDKNLVDGFGDDTGQSAYLDFFENFMNISAIRDKMRQSALDFSRVAMMIRGKPSLAALAGPYAFTPKLDPDRVAYLGESFGTVVGTDLAAIEPSIGMYIFDVPGGGVLDQILVNSPEIADLAVPFAQSIYRPGPGTLDRFHPLVGMFQMIFDGADSLTFAHHVLRERFTIENEMLTKRHVVCIQALTDEIMPHQATEALARAFGLHVLAPNLGVPDGMFQIASPGSNNVAGQTGILVQYEPATHGYNWSAEHGQLGYEPGWPFDGDDPFPKLPKKITINEPIYETQAQVAEILSTYFAGVSPVVRSTKPPIPDFDDDGRLDSSDPDPTDPAK